MTNRTNDARTVVNMTALWVRRGEGILITRSLVAEMADVLGVHVHPRTVATELNRAVRNGHIPADWLRIDPRRWEWDGTPRIRR